MSTNEHILPYGQNAPATVAAALLALGADYVQGYFFARPHGEIIEPKF